MIEFSKQIANAELNASEHDCENSQSQIFSVIIGHQARHLSGSGTSSLIHCRPKPAVCRGLWSRSVAATRKRTPYCDRRYSNVTGPECPQTNVICGRAQLGRVCLRRS